MTYGKETYYHMNWTTFEVLITEDHNNTSLLMFPVGLTLHYNGTSYSIGRCPILVLRPLNRDFLCLSVHRDLWHILPVDTLVRKKSDLRSGSLIKVKRFNYCRFKSSKLNPRDLEISPVICWVVFIDWKFNIFHIKYFYIYYFNVYI